jgi:hypothetical protein
MSPSKRQPQKNCQLQLLPLKEGPNAAGNPAFAMLTGASILRQSINALPSNLMERVLRTSRTSWWLSGDETIRPRH